MGSVKERSGRLQLGTRCGAKPQTPIKRTASRHSSEVPELESHAKAHLAARTSRCTRSPGKEGGADMQPVSRMEKCASPRPPQREQTAWQRDPELPASPCWCGRWQ